MYVMRGLDKFEDLQLLGLPIPPAYLPFCRAPGARAMFGGLLRLESDTETEAGILHAPVDGTDRHVVGK